MPSQNLVKINGNFKAKSIARLVLALTFSYCQIDLSISVFFLIDSSVSQSF